jgi:hypothetical protein
MGSPGGAADEAGGQYRRGVAAFFIAHGLNGLPLEGLPLHGTAARVEDVALETDFPIDDILVRLSSGRMFVQAKRTLSPGRPLDEVANQWLVAVRNPTFTPSTDLICAVTGDIRGGIRGLDQALARLRSETLFGIEDKAVEVLRKALRKLGANEQEVELILSRAVVLRLRVEDVAQEHAQRGLLLLDGHVVMKGEGSRAWRELLAVAGDAARQRVGQSIGGWLKALRDRGIPLTADAEASRAAHLESRQLAISRYRGKLRERGEFVDLTALGVALPPIPLRNMDAGIRVKDPSGVEKHGDDLDPLWSFRRRGRVVLTGLPGSGKSTTVAATAAEWSRREDWALPLSVSLGRVAEKERFRKRSLRDELLDIAVESLDAPDRPFVREFLDEALSSGDVVLFLDGLDEAANRSLNLASDINLLLREVHPDVDVLVATRDVAFANARILGFKTLRMLPPSQTDFAIESVLRAFAQHHEIDIEKDGWLSSRMGWLQALFKQDPQLKEAPILPVLLAIHAAENRAGQLPSTRARILEQAIKDVVRRKESRRELRLTSIANEHQADAALGAFPMIASVLMRNGGFAKRELVCDELSEYYQYEWGLPPAVARATAGEVLVFWDESGMFVARDAEHTVEPRHRLFLEIGAALQAATYSTDQAVDWVEGMAARDDAEECLVLAAGLSPEIAGALIERSRRGDSVPDDRLALAAASALRQGGSVDEGKVRLLIARLLPLVARGDHQALDAYQALVRLPVPHDLEGAVLGVMSGAFSVEFAALATGMAALQWGWPPDRRDRALEQVLEFGEVPHLSSKQAQDSRPGLMPFLRVSADYDEVFEKAARIILPKRPDLASRVARAMEHASFSTSEVLQRALKDNGHEGLMKDWQERIHGPLSDFMKKTGEFQRDRKENILNVLKATSALGEAGTLDRRKERRLDELASFITTLNLDDPSAYLPGKENHSLRVEWHRLIARLGGFDEAVLAAQAKIVLDELAAEEQGSNAAFSSLFDGAAEAELLRWDRVQDQAEARKLVLFMLRLSRGLSKVAAHALASNPDRETTASAITDVFPGMTRDCLRAATWAFLNLVDNWEAAVHLAKSDYPTVRGTIARLAPLVENGELTELGRYLATDSERFVQNAALEKIENGMGGIPTDKILALLEQISSEEDNPFVCQYCGATNDAAMDSCMACRVVTRRPSEVAGKILASFRGGG